MILIGLNYILLISYDLLLLYLWILMLYTKMLADYVQN